MGFRVHVVLLAATVLQSSQAKPAVVEWYLKKQDKEAAKPAKVNQNVRAFRAKQEYKPHEQEWAAAVAEVKGEEEAPKKSYGKKTPYTPNEAKPAKKEKVEARKPEGKKPAVAKTSSRHDFKVKAVGAEQPVTTGAAKSATSLHNTDRIKVAWKTDSKSKSGSKDQAHKAHKKSHASPAASPGAGPAMGPAPAPAPAPLDYAGRVSKLKGDMMNKLKSDSFDADFVIERPNKVLPGTSAGKENAVPEFKDVGNDAGPYAKKAKPLENDDISFKSNSLPVDAAHVNRETMTSDWHMEYGPNGPKGTHSTSPGRQGGSFAPLAQR